MRLDGWPRYYAGNLTLGNLESNAGVCTLWTEQRALTERLDPSAYAVCGNLYSLWGIGFLVRNVLANPHLRYLVLCGADRSGSGQTLVNLVAQGVNEEGLIVGTRGRLDPLIPSVAVERFRQGVRLIDRRGVLDSQQIAATLQGLPSLPPFGDPEHFPDPQPAAAQLPSEGTGFKVAEDTVALAWLRALRLVMSFGRAKPSEAGGQQRQILNLIAVVTAEEPERPFLAPWLPFGQEELEHNRPRIAAPDDPAVEDGGGRQVEAAGRGFRLGGGISFDQIDAMTRRLMASPHSPTIAMAQGSMPDAPPERPPSLVELHAAVQEGRLFLTAVYASHDVYGAWPENAFALRRLQRYIAGRAGAGLGPMTIISQSAYVPEGKWPAVRRLLHQHYPKTLAWRDDPRGNFHISVEGDRVLAEHGTTVDGATGRRYDGANARSIYLAIVNAQMVSLPEHAAYLGAELTKAEVALRLGVPYVQDRPLPLGQPDEADQAADSPENST